jgi:stage III sporulation protein AG
MKIDFLKDVMKIVERYKYLIIIIAAGILLLLIPSISEREKEVQATPVQEVFSLSDEEKRIAKALSEAAGVGKTEVVLTLKSSIETVYQSDVTSQSSVSQDNTESSVSSETVVISSGSGSEQAIVQKRFYPEYRGALVICERADSPTVKLKVINAMKALTGLPSDKITVLSRKSP